MVTRVIWALLLFWFFVSKIGSWTPGLSPYGVYLAYLLGIGIPAAIIFNPICEDIYEGLKTRIINGSVKEAIFGSPVMNTPMEEPAGCQNPCQDIPDIQSSSLLTEAQIEQLNNLRARMTIGAAKRFPYIKIAGSSMKNVIPDAGIFTAQIRRKGSSEVTNTVVMMPTTEYCPIFKRAYNDIGNCDFQAEGFLLPSRTGACYAVLFVTVLTLGNRPVIWWKDGKRA